MAIQPVTMKVFRPIRLFAVLGLALLVHGVGHGQRKRNLQPDTVVPTRLSENGKYYAIVIGINHYPPRLPSLVTAVHDAQAIADVLKQDYGFQVTLLLDGDATRNHILDTISSYRDKLNENDNLLIYYAGHGYSDRGADKAYWLPVDADSIYSSNRIIADDLTTDVRGQNARHVLIVSDSCYSGGLTRSVNSPTESAGRMVFLNRMLSNRSRTLMASGGDEPVSDSGTDGHSVFAYAILRSLQRPEQPIFTGSDLLYGSVRQQVAGKSSQVPQYAYIRNSDDEQGDFVFVRNGVQLTQVQPAVPQVPTVDQTLPSRATDSFVLLHAPAGAEIHVDREFAAHSTGEVFRVKVQPGPREIEVFQPGYQPWKQVVSAQAGKQVELTATLVAAVASDAGGHSAKAGMLSEADMNQIRNLLAHYAGAVNSRDIKQMKAVWPEIPGNKAEQVRTLPKGARISLSVVSASLLETNENAVVRCKQTLEQDGKSSDDNVTFYLGRLRGGWIINQIPSSN